MNTIGAVSLAVLGLLGAYYFLVVHGQHSDHVNQLELEHKIQTERFDRDFEQAWNGQKRSDPARAQRLLDLEKQQAEAKTKAATQLDDHHQREQALRRALDQLSGSPRTKGSP